MCAALMKYETIDSSQIDELMERKPVSDPDGWVEDDHHHKEPAAESEGPASDCSPEDDSTSEDVSETGGEDNGIDPDVPETPDSSDKNIH